MLRSLFNRSDRLSRALLAESDATGEILISLTDYAELERDLGSDQAARVTELLCRRLQQELGSHDELRAASQGVFSIAVRDPEAVDLEKLGNHLVAAIEGEPVTLNRALIECRANARIIAADSEPIAATA